MRYGFVIDNRRCIGCHACTVACKAEHSVPVGINRTWVKYVEKGIFPHSRRHFTVHRCNHCENAPCVTICPVRSLFIRQDGIVDFNKERCIGCRSCMQACPYDALYIDPESHTSGKCNFCAHRVERGIEPSCVVVCPGRAIISGDLDNPGSEIARLVSREQVSVRRPEKGTLPKLFYIQGDATSLLPEEAPPRQSYMQTEQAAGVGHHAHAGSSATASGLLPADEEAASQRVYDAPAKGVLWGWEIPAYLWSKSIGAGLLFLPLLLQLLGDAPPSAMLAKTGAVLALVFLAITGGLLIKDLDRPERFIYVLLRPQWGSWLVRGGYIINILALLATLWLLSLFFEFTTGRLVLQLAMALFAVAAAIYTAFLFAQAKGRDFWQSPLLPFHMLIQSVITGSATLLLLTLWLGDHPSLGVVVTLQGGLGLHLLLLFMECSMPHVTADTGRTLHMITSGMFSWHFWSTVLLGNLLPLLLLVGDTPWQMSAALLSLFFAFVVEWIWVRAPQLLPMR